MKDRNQVLALVLGAAFVLAALSGCGGEKPSSGGAGGGETEVTPPETLPAASDAAVPRTPAEAELTGAAVITLSGTDVEIQGGGAGEADGVVTITAGGTYAVSGVLDEGRIIVNAPGDEVTLVLNGADISCSYGSPLYIYQSSRTVIHLMEGTENTLTDGESYTYADSLSSAAEEEPNACLYSKSDLVIQGAGALTVRANCNNGITGKDTLEIYDGVLSVTAVNHGINGKDANTIDSASVTVSCGGDAIRSTNDTDGSLGWVRISNSALDLTAGEDGIQAETGAALSGSSCTIVSGGGSTASLAADASAKGIKAGGDLSLSGGVYALDCADDAIHANGNVTVSGGVYTLSTGDDGVHADGTLTVSGGQINILSSYEGLEGSDVDISGGEIFIVSSDDGINAAGGTDGSGFGGRGMGNAFGPAGGGTAYSLTVSGGSVCVVAGGDGLDANGSITMTGGTVLVSSTGGGDGALDYDAGFTLTGGVLLAASAGSMAQAPTAQEQYTLAVQFGTTLPAGAYVQFAGGDREFVFRLNAPANHIVFSSPELEAGDSYTVSYGGEYTGESAGGLCSGGAYSGGTVLTELTITEALTTYGQVGMGGSRGGGMVGEPGQNGSFGRGGWEDQGGTGPEGPGGAPAPGGKHGG